MENTQEDIWIQQMNDFLFVEIYMIDDPNFNVTMIKELCIDKFYEELNPTERKLADALLCAYIKIRDQRLEIEDADSKIWELRDELAECDNEISNLVFDLNYMEECVRRNVND